MDVIIIKFSNHKQLDIQKLVFQKRKRNHVYTSPVYGIRETEYKISEEKNGK